MSVTAFKDLPLASRDREWDHDAAEARVRRWAKAENGPNAKYRGAHVWYDPDNKDEFGAYKLLIADVINGQLRVVPRGDVCGRRRGWCPRRRAHSQTRHPAREVAPREVLQEDGR